MASRSYSLLSGKLIVPDDSEPYVEYQTGYRSVRVPCEFVISDEEIELKAGINQVITYLEIKFGSSESALERIEHFMKSTPPEKLLGFFDGHTLLVDKLIAAWYDRNWRS